MYQIKVRFTLLVAFFLVLLLSFTLAYNYLNKQQNPDNIYSDLIQYSTNIDSVCHFVSVEPTIILRMDDVRSYSKLTKPLIDEIIKRNISITLGVIPGNLEKDASIINYLSQIKLNPNIEIAQHGTNHNPNESSIDNVTLIEGYNKIVKILQVSPVTYIPPYNNLSSQSKDIASNYFKILSGEQGILKEDEKIIEVGYTVATYDYSRNKFVSNSDIIDKCHENLNKMNFCVVVIHPQEYSKNITNPEELSLERFKEFQQMLDKLSSLNASFSTFSHVVNCKL